MTFFDKITEMNYVVLDRNTHGILIKKCNDVADIYVYFDLDLKTLSGYVLTKKVLVNIGDVATNYRIFRSMKSDLETFQKLSRYDILNTL